MSLSAILTEMRARGILLPPTALKQNCGGCGGRTPNDALPECLLRILEGRYVVKCDDLDGRKPPERIDPRRCLKCSKRQVMTPSASPRVSGFPDGAAGAPLDGTDRKALPPVDSGGRMDGRSREEE